MIPHAMAVCDRASLPPAIDRFFRATGVASVPLALELIGRWQDGTLPRPDGIDGLALEDAGTRLRAIPGGDAATPAVLSSPLILPPGGVLAPVGTQGDDEGGDSCPAPPAEGPGGI